MPRLGLCAAVLCLGVRPLAAWAGPVEGRVGMEMEYLGQSYYTEQRLTALDLGLPSGSDFLITDTTRFADDTWLPGQRVDLGWRSSPDSRGRWRIASRTEANRERFSQDLDLRGELPDARGGRWRFAAAGSFRDDERSLVGKGDWRTTLDASREVPLGTGARGGLRLGWEHSRTRGDTVSYLYDYDQWRTGIFASGGTGWLPVWEGRLEAVFKQVPGNEPGGYSEVRSAGSWRSSEGVAHADLEVRFRSYTMHGVGRDFLSAEAESGNRLWERGANSLALEAQATFWDYRGEDDLYFDSLEGEVRVPWKRDGPWTVTAGPAGRALVDLDGGGRDYLEGSLRAGLSRILGAGGFADLSAEAGYRDYRSGADWIEIASLSTSVLRSDAWILECLGMGAIPLGAGFTLDVLASTSWEVHVHESERVQVTYANLGIGRAF